MAVIERVDATRVQAGRDLEIVSVEAIASSIPNEHPMRLGLGTMVKRDAVVVKIVTRGGLVGYGEAHHGRSPGTVAHLVNNSLRPYLLGRSADDVVGIWETVYDNVLATHGLGAASSIGLSGVDLALWDIRGKAVGLPLYRLLGGSAKAVPAYAGGMTLGYQAPESLAENAQRHVEEGYTALKLRIGDGIERDVARITAVRRAVGDVPVLLSDANTRYSLDDVRQVMPVLEEEKVRWLEEPFPPHDYRLYQEASRLGRVALAAGENHYTRFEFHRLVDDRAVSVLQPDLSKCGGLTEALRIAAIGSAWKLSINPHCSVTGLNHAATIHFLASIPGGGYFEADGSPPHAFRAELTSSAYQVEPQGNVHPLEAPGIGVEVNEDFLRAHPVIEGPCYV
jgi:D-galactarolactone cycloisomerase